MLKLIFNKLLNGLDITYSQSKFIFREIMLNRLSILEIVCILVSMKVKGESFDEIFGAVKGLLSINSVIFNPNYYFCDISGTGGDNIRSINISTLSAIVASNCGIKVAKHFNRSFSGYFGSYKLLRMLKVTTNDSLQQSINKLNKFNICFLFASNYFLNCKNLLYVRKELKISSIFNIIGPLTNPLRPKFALIGVYDIDLLLIVANIVKKLGYIRVIVVCTGKVDEISLHDTIEIAELNLGKISRYQLTPKDFGLSYQSLEEICCSSNKEVYDFSKNLLQGKGKKSHEFVVSANVAILLKLFGRENLKENVSFVLSKIQKGNLYKKLLDVN